MTLHTQEAAIEYQYECAHASDEFLEEDESVSTDESAFTCVICGCNEVFVDGKFECGC